MKKSLSILSRLSCLVVFLGCFTLVSCDEEEPGEEVDKTLVIITIPETSILSTTDVWFFLTDNNGGLLGVQQAVRGVDMVFERPEGFTEDRFALHKVSYSESTFAPRRSISILSFTNMEPGEYGLFETTGEQATDLGFHTLVVNNVPSTYFVRPNGSTGSMSSNYLNGGITANASLYRNNKGLLYFISDFQNRTLVPRYTYFANASAGQSETVNFADLSVASSTTIDFGEEMDAASVFLTRHGEGGYLEFFSVTNANSAKVYHPGSGFEPYNTELTLTDGSSSYYHSKVGAIPASFKKIEASVNSFDGQGHQFTLTTTGKYDYALARSSSQEWTTGDWHNVFSWVVYMNDDGEKQFSAPSIPEAITSRYPEFVDKTPIFNHVSLYEMNDLVGYEDVVTQLLRPKDSVSTPRTETLSLGKNF